MQNLLLTICALASLSSPSLACTLVAPPARPGETVEQARDKLATEEQQANWERSASVSLAKIIQIRLIDEPTVETTFRPVDIVRGALPPDSVVFTGPPVLGCYAFTIGDWVILYATPAPQTGGWRVDNVVATGDVVDARVLQSLKGRTDFDDLGFRTPE